MRNIRFFLLLILFITTFALQFGMKQAYWLDGRETSVSATGLLLVRSADGKVYKVMRK